MGGAVDITEKCISLTSIIDVYISGEQKVLVRYLHCVNIGWDWVYSGAYSKAHHFKICCRFKDIKILQAQCQLGPNAAIYSLYQINSKWCHI